MNKSVASRHDKTLALVNVDEYESSDDGTLAIVEPNEEEEPRTEKWKHARFLSETGQEIVFYVRRYFGRNRGEYGHQQKTGDGD